MSFCLTSNSLDIVRDSEDHGKSVVVFTRTRLFYPNEDILQN